MPNFKIIIESKSSYVNESFEFDFARDSQYKKFKYRLETLLKVVNQLQRMRLRKMRGEKDESTEKN